jgi:hypothetical protein
MQICWPVYVLSFRFVDGFLNPQTDNKTTVIEQTGVAETLLTYIQKVFCPNLGRETGYV